MLANRNLCMSLLQIQRWLFPFRKCILEFVELWYGDENSVTSNTQKSEMELNYSWKNASKVTSAIPVFSPRACAWFSKSTVDTLNTKSSLFHTRWHSSPVSLRLPYYSMCAYIGSTKCQWATDIRVNKEQRLWHLQEKKRSIQEQTSWVSLS